MPATRPSEPADVREQRIRRLFARLDTKKKGVLDVEAIREGFAKYDHPLAHASGITDEFMLRADIDKDGVINYEDFHRFVDTTEAKLWNIFVAIDKDNSGRLDRAEVQQALQVSGATVSADKVALFFSWIDKDSDGEISFDDFCHFLLFMPLETYTLRAAYAYFASSVPITSDGDFLMSLFSDEMLGGIGYFVAGGAAGVISRTMTAPFDRLKVYLIARTESAAPATAEAREIAKMRGSPLLNAIRVLWRHGGVRNFFVGNGLNILKVLPESAIKFGSFESAKRYLAELEGVDVGELSQASSFIAGGIGGAVAQFAVYPIDTLKFRVQCEDFSSSLRGNALLVHTAKNMWRSGGVPAYYRGLVIGVGGVFPYAALDLGTFEFMKKGYIKATSQRLHINEADVKLGNMAVLTMGALSGSVSATLVYPLNLLRTRLQAQGTTGHPQHYTGMADVWRKTVQNEGYRGLFRGLVPNLAKVAPAVSISYLVYENSKTLMGLA
ncbi:mitochondrial carrier domain-containing protein [Dipodascopsis tothii]|uniref:mitochondrial carrier domain-containing protein n=1 Tax=Dipodascopsis tothii TaxID=44089 RepID=UPI0034CEBBF3